MTATVVRAQEISVTYDKTRDMTGYKTFRFGESEVITPKDMRRQDEKKTRELVTGIIAKELNEKKLQQVDSGAQLVVSFVVGYVDRADIYNAGPLGGTPGAVNSGAVVQDFQQSTLVVDLDDASDNLIWRINATVRSSSNDYKTQIEQAIDKGYRKFPNKPKPKKK